jgi:hypothetical protein
MRNLCLQKVRSFKLSDFSKDSLLVNVRSTKDSSDSALTHFAIPPFTEGKNKICSLGQKQTLPDLCQARPIHHQFLRISFSI